MDDSTADSVATQNGGSGFSVWGCRVCHPRRTQAYHVAYSAWALAMLLSNPVGGVCSMVKAD